MATLYTRQIRGYYAESSLLFLNSFGELQCFVLGIFTPNLRNFYLSFGELQCFILNLEEVRSNQGILTPNLRTVSVSASCSVLFWGQLRRISETVSTVSAICSVLSPEPEVVCVQGSTMLLCVHLTGDIYAESAKDSSFVELWRFVPNCDLWKINPFPINQPPLTLLTLRLKRGYCVLTPPFF